MGGRKVAETIGPALELAVFLGDRTHWDVTIGKSLFCLFVCFLNYSQTISQSKKVIYLDCGHAGKTPRRR